MEVDLTRKELYITKSSQVPSPQEIDDVFSRHPRDYLDIHTHQMFCRNFFNAETSHKALILEHDCHAAGTKLVTIYGGIPSLTRIEDIVVGTIVATESGTSIVAAIKTGTDDMYDLSFKIGDMPIRIVTCNASHLVTTDRGDIPIVDMVGKEDEYRLIVPQPQTTREMFARAFTSAYVSYRSGMPSDELQTWAAICGMKFVADSSPRGYTVAPLISTLVPFTVTPRDRGTYYGITLIGNNEADRRYILAGGILTHNTGTGKTITACNIISTYLDAYRKTYDNLARKTTLYGLEKMAYLDETTPCVLIVGFEGTQDAFFRELTNYTAFGFVTPSEKDQLSRLRNIVDRPEATADDHRRLKDFTSRLRRRLSDKAAGGFIDFKGFQELVNFIFDIRDKDITLDYIEKEASARNVPVDDIFNELISAGALRPRTDNIRKYDSALIVVDELHNTYNSRGKNSRGIVLEYLIRQTKNSRFLGLTATLLNASPAEMVDVLSYVRAAAAPSLPRLRREDYFGISAGRDVFLSPNVPEILGELSAGYFSYLRDSDPRYYPKVSFVGEEATLTGEYSPGRIMYQRFWKVPMSSSLQRAHDLVVTEHGMDAGRIRVPIQSEVIFDMTLPLPDGRVMTSADEVYRVLQSAPREFLEESGISIGRDATGITITGRAFMTKESISLTKGAAGTVCLEETSPKYVKFLELLRATSGKCMAFHKRVRGSGVILIAEILRLNGYVFDDSEPTSTSICSRCGVRMKDHSKAGHAFAAARFLMAYGQNKSEMPRVLQKFNSPLNSDGSRYKLLLGSKVMRESYDFKAIKDIFMLDEPNHISMTLQVYGRAVRKNSHISLPPEERFVNIHTLVHVVNPAFPSIVPDSAQLQRYKMHMDEYLLIQEVDRARRKYAVDASINAATIWGHGIGGTAIPPLQFTPINDVPDGLTLDQLHTANFRSRKYFKYEMEMVMTMIKRLFMLRHVYTFADLVTAIKSPPFTVQVNTGLFDETLISIVLMQMVNTPKLVGTHQPDIPPSQLMYNLTNPAERRIITPEGIYKVTHVGSTRLREGQYILVPCNPEGDVIVDALVDQQSPPTTTRRSVKINSLVSGSLNQKRYNAAVNDIIDATQGNELSDFVSFMMTYPVAYQCLFIEDCIRWDYDAIPKGKKARSVDLILSGMNAFGAAVTMHEMRIYKQADKYLPGSSKISEDKIIGYETLESVRLLTADGSFTDVSKTIFNRMEEYRDVPPIIAFIEDVPGEKPRYKIRSTDEVIGIVCASKPKDQLAAILTQLGVKPSDNRIKTYCRELLEYLIDHEITARENMSKDKYFYGWWNRPVSRQ